MGGKIPMAYADGSHNKSGSPPVTAPEPSRVLDSSEQPLAKEGEPAVPMTSDQSEASDNLLEVLRRASLDEEHRTLLGTVIEKVRSTKSGYTEASASLLIGFEVSNKIVRKYHSIDSIP